MGGAEAATSFGRLLQRHRIAAGLTQEALAEQTGLGVRTIQGLETGEHLPRRDTARRLAEVLRLVGEARAELERAAQPPPRQAAVPAATRDVPADQAGQRPRRDNLPAPLTSFVGRESEIEEIQGRLRSARLLTLTGTGGCGKTRLALQIATDLLGSYPDGVWLAELAAVSDRQFVPFAIAGAVGVQAEPGQPIEYTLLAALRSRRLLLVLDNCEHLIDASARLAEALLRGCPAVQILATSREALGVAGEVVRRVPSLAVPPGGQLPRELGDPAGLSRFASVRLFVERAQLVVPGFVLGAVSASAVAQICWRLDGIPLAIELAAARVQVLGPEQVAARLDDQFRLLTGGSRTALPRQQTLKATVDWSYDLLPVPERVLFGRLSAFAGGWSLEAAEAVGAGAGIDQDAVLDLLTQLVAKSLVQVEQDAREERYRLLETLREYGQVRLEEAGDVAAVRDRHRDWFLRLAEWARPELTGPEQLLWLGRLEREHDNFRAALEWTLERGPAILALRLVGALWRLWYARDYVAEGREWIRRALATPGASDPSLARGEVLFAAWEMGMHLATARPVAEERLAICRALDDRRGIADSLRVLARVANEEGDTARAEELATQALKLAREEGARWVEAQTIETLGVVARQKADDSLACSRFEESLAIYRELGDRRAVGMGLLFLGYASIGQGEPRVVRAYLLEALAIARELRSRGRISFGLLGLANLAQRDRDFGSARPFLEENLSLARESQDQKAIGVALLHLGSLTWAEGDIGRAAALISESISAFRDGSGRAELGVAISYAGMLAVARGAHWPGARLLGAGDPQSARRVLPGRWQGPDDRRVYEESVVAARVALGEADFATAWSEGRTMTLEDAVELALAVGKPESPD